MGLARVQILATGLDYLSAWLIGLIVSAIHGGFALAERWRRRKAPARRA